MDNANLLSLQSWINEAEKTNTCFSDYCLEIHSKHLEMPPEKVLDRMASLLTVMEESIKTGMNGTISRGGLIGGEAKKFRTFANTSEQSLLGATMNKAVTYALAVGECNAAMGRIVAAPTAGASGVLPAILFTLKEEKGFSITDLSKALIVAGAIGMIIATRATISGAAGGCQAECGSGAAMAAGAAVALCGGTPSQVGDAVAITMKNMLGLVCDPVAGLVEVPCVKRNAGAVSQALVAAEMALAGIKSVIPVDEVIDAMKSVGDSLHCSLKETAQGGLAATPTGLAWANKVLNAKPDGEE